VRYAVRGLDQSDRLRIDAAVNEVAASRVLDRFDRCPTSDFSEASRGPTSLPRFFVVEVEKEMRLGFRGAEMHEGVSGPRVERLPRIRLDDLQKGRFRSRVADRPERTCGRDADVALAVEKHSRQRRNRGARRPAELAQRVRGPRAYPRRLQSAGDAGLPRSVTPTGHRGRLRQRRAVRHCRLASTA
jgi:hypothetical protein